MYQHKDTLSPHKVNNQMKSIKEKQLIVKWSKAMNEPIDQDLLHEVEVFENLQKQIIESVKQNTIKDLVEASKSKETLNNTQQHYPKPPTLEEVLSVVKEESNDQLVHSQTEEKPATTTTTKTKKDDLISRSVDQITKVQKLEEKKDSYQQPEADTPRSINELKRKVKVLEEWLGKISLTGPGGGAGDIINLDMPTTLVTSDYTITRRDYYVGVNCAVKANITLPDPSTIVNGREVIIKDESGHAQLTPIKVIGNVDNDPNGFEIRINNGSVTLLYRNGWRIV